MAIPLDFSLILPDLRVHDNPSRADLRRWPLRAGLRGVAVLPEWTGRVACGGQAGIDLFAYQPSPFVALRDEPLTQLVINDVQLAFDEDSLAGKGYVD